jgi:DNA-binding transcriptional ArsR family regulator
MTKNDAKTQSKKSSKDEDFIPNDEGEYLLSLIKPELNQICSNPVRACIIHMLVQNKDLDHTMQVEEMSKRLGKRHSVIIYHLERLEDWGIVHVVKKSRYGDEGVKRRIWGLNLNYPTMVKDIYGRILKHFYTQKQLEKMCAINQNVRDSKR